MRSTLGAALGLTLVAAGTLVWAVAIGTLFGSARGVLLALAAGVGFAVAAVGAARADEAATRGRLLAWGLGVAAACRAVAYAFHSLFSLTIVATSSLGMTVGVAIAAFAATKPDPRERARGIGLGLAVAAGASVLFFVDDVVLGWNPFTLGNVLAVVGLALATTHFLRLAEGKGEPRAPRRDAGAREGARD